MVAKALGRDDAGTGAVRGAGVRGEVRRRGVVEREPGRPRSGGVAERDYADMEDEVRTLEARGAELKRRQQASRDSSHLTGVYHPPEKAISEDALYVDALLAEIPA